MTIAVADTCSFFVPNRRGRRIFCLLSKPREPTGSEAGRLLIMPPAYEKEARDYLVPALYFSKNGLPVLRFDAPNHVGRSDGAIYDYDMVENHETVTDLIEYVHTVLGFEKLAFLATSLSSRYVLRGIARSSHRAKIDVIVHIVPVVDLRKTLNVVSRRDFFADPDFQESKVLEHVVCRTFIDRARQDQMETLESTLADIRTIRARNHAILASGDEWVEMRDARAVFGDEISVLPGGIHEIGKNPNAGRTVMTKAVQLITRRAPDEIEVPTFPEIVAFNECERINENLAKVD